MCVVPLLSTPRHSPPLLGGTKSAPDTFDPGLELRLTGVEVLGGGDVGRVDVAVNRNCTVRPLVPWRHTLMGLRMLKPVGPRFWSRFALCQRTTSEGDSPPSSSSVLYT